MDNLRYALTNLHSDPAFHLVQQCSTKGAADLELLKIEADAATKKVEALIAQLQLAREKEEAALKRYENCEKRQKDILGLYDELSPRLAFPLPTDITASVLGRVGMVRHRAACVCKVWRSSVALAQSLGFYKMKIQFVSTGGTPCPNLNANPNCHRPLSLTLTNSVQCNVRR